MKKIASNPKLNNSAILTSTNINNNQEPMNKNLSNSKVIQLNHNRNFNDIKERLKNNIKNELADQFKKK